MEPSEKFFAKKNTITGIAIFLFILVCVAYSNHFTNGFEFDDTHSITNNEYIRDINNLPLFFTDIKYFGTNPGNQGYRPVLVSMNAIDYWLAGDLNPVYFHVDIFLSYLVLLILLFVFFKNIFNTSVKNEYNSLIALLAVGFFGVHAANAETINYICQRADSFSTLCIVASMVLYIHPKARKYYLYLITVAIGLGTKETGAVFGLILFFYILLFEEKVSLVDLILFKKIKSSFKALIKSLPALIFSLGLFFLIMKTFFQENPVISSVSSPSSFMDGFMTQWVILVHYIGNFILPLDLSADPDFGVYTSILNRKVMLSLFVLLFLIFIAFVTSGSEKNRPIAFGIIWFFLALAPTVYSSSVNTNGQIANDHRTFFPYIGLVLSLGWWLRLMYPRFENVVKEYSHLPKVLFALFLAVVTLHAYGTYQRNIVWSSSETLWHDATVKSPNNGRAQMNYGLCLMGKGQYEETMKYFNRTLELMPYWAFIHINMGILREAMGFHDEAEQYFKNAIRYQPFVPDGYYFYARWLHSKERIDEAITQLEKGRDLSPGHTRIKEYLNDLIAARGETPLDKINKLKKQSEENPTAYNFVELSLAYYKQEMYKECVEACKSAVKIDPKSGVAYNNMCSAYNALEQWENAVAAGEKALEIDSTFQRARNNLNWALKNLKK